MGNVGNRQMYFNRRWGGAWAEKILARRRLLAELGPAGALNTGIKS